MTTAKDYSNDLQYFPSTSYSYPTVTPPGAVGPLDGTLGGYDWNAAANVGNINSGAHGTINATPGSDNYDNEPPLLDELGIHPYQIFTRTLAVSIPFRPLPAMSEHDADLAGPLLFCVALGSALLLAGKIHFGYIYGFGLIGCLLLYCLLNLITEEPITIDRTVSVLGYALVPLVLLSLVAVMFNLRNSIGAVLTVGAVVWSTATATRMFEAALSLTQQRYIVAYPITILYAVFALLTVY